jgi:hypothetical protein
MKAFFLSCFLTGVWVISSAQKGCELNSNLTPGNIGLPSQLKTDEKKTVVVHVENNGTCVWKKPDVTLKIIIYRGPSGSAVQREELVPIEPVYADETSIAPGKWTYFRYEIEGPSYAGDYTLHFTLQHKGKPFGDLERKNIKIVKAR